MEERKRSASSARASTMMDSSGDGDGDSGQDPSSEGGDEGVSERAREWVSERAALSGMRAHGHSDRWVLLIRAV